MVANINFHPYNAEKQKAKFEDEHRQPPGSRRFVELSTGIRAHYLSWGDNDRVVILLHDVGEASGQLSYLGSRLGQKGYRVFAPDLRGHGDTAHSSDCQYDAESLANDLESFIIELDLYFRPVALVGFGFGGGGGANFDPGLKAPPGSEF